MEGEHTPSIIQLIPSTDLAIIHLEDSHFIFFNSNNMNLMMEVSEEGTGLRCDWHRLRRTWSQRAERPFEQPNKLQALMEVKKLGGPSIDHSLIRQLARNFEPTHVGISITGPMLITSFNPPACFLSSTSSNISEKVSSCLPMVNSLPYENL